jgi:hypothetical protein
VTAVPVLADRVMRARRETRCPDCFGWIRVGQQIARCPGGVWFHASCFIGHTHDTDRPAGCGAQEGTQ